MAVDRAAAAVLDGANTATDTIRAQVLAALERLWRSLPDYYDATIDGFVARWAPIMDGAQAQVGAVTATYLARLEGAVLGAPPRPIGVPPAVTTTEALRGVPAETVWRRPAVEVYRALDDGVDLATAVDRGLARARSIAETDLQLAHTHAVAHVQRANRAVAGYRRVPRGAGSCALCLLAATQRYRRGQLMPIHPGCHCKTHTIYGHHDPGQVLDPAGVDAVHAAVASFTGQPTDRAATAVDYRKFVVAHDHGEIGPVLARRNQDWTGPRDIKTERARARRRAADQAAGRDVRGTPNQEGVTPDG